MREALRAYLGFAGATSVDWPEHLRRDGRLFGTKP
jgi:hypothetical protein